MGRAHAKHTGADQDLGVSVVTHKDLSDVNRDIVIANATWVAHLSFQSGQPLALAREAWINAFDKAAEELEK